MVRFKKWFFFFKQKTAYEMRISDWSSDVCSSDLAAAPFPHAIYTSHVRDEGNYNIGVVEAVEEVITVAREAKIPGVVTHIKVLGHKRSEERRVGKECGSTCRSRWSRYH